MKIEQTRKEVPVKNNPGIYKFLKFDSEQRKWIDSGKYLSTRRSNFNGKSMREKAVFDNLGDAKDFRAGKLAKSNVRGVVAEKSDLSVTRQEYTFAKLVDDWKAMHFLSLAKGTRQFYERKVPLLASLERLPVAKIDVEVIDALVKEWVKRPSKRSGRMCFDHELKVLVVILNFYRTRKDPSFVVPVQKGHYESATLIRRTRGEIKALSEDELGLFLQGLRLHVNSFYYPLALTQFCLGLRIGEACGLRWSDFDFVSGVVNICRTVVWDDQTWEASIEEGTKNGKSRQLGITEGLKKALLEFRKKSPSFSEMVFHKNGEPLNSHARAARAIS